MAINFKAGGELTIVDISDSKQLSSLISSLLQRQVIFDPNDNTYSPNYTSVNNVLVPQLFITGNMEDIITQAKSVNWYYQVNSIGTKIPITVDTTDYTLNTTTKQLTIKTNVLQANLSMNYITEIVYTDPNTGMDVKNISQIELLKITNGVHGVDGDNPVIAVLTNESHTISSDADGLNMNFSGANSEIKIFEGIRDITSEWVITVSASTGITGSLATASGFVYTVTNMTSDSGYVDLIATKSSTVLKKRFTLTKVRHGRAGVDGKTPIKGTDYFDGIDGQNGESSYVWIMYSQNADGSNMIDNPTSAKYIGITTTKTNIKPTSNTSYIWNLVKGEVGIKGEAGLNGESSYLHIKYSDDGTTFTANNGETVGIWIGNYVDFIEGDSLTPSKYTWSKVKGEDATAYWLTGYPTAIKKNGLSVYTPLNFSATIISQTGVTSPSSYLGRFIIQETTDSTTWVTKYTSTANESTKNFTPSAGIKAVKVRAYLTGGTTTLIDEQIIPVVEDGSDPVIAILSTPLGTAIRNNTGNLTIEANLYKGGTIVTPTDYKWYELDTNVAGGWRQLTSSVPDGTTGYTTKTLTVTPSSIVSLSTYKVEATYNGLVYSDMITLADLNDPISTVIIGSGIYKNGQGTNSYTSRLYRNGTEIDVNGVIYTYQWNLLDKDGTLNPSFTATGKTINIPATAFADTSQLKCDVSDNK